ncbi:spherulation-specific family 4 protein [Cellulomonas sp. ATA003]|uniref:spherulation-specific family 4 protein n=1 Tax=Cellulomonas sp. ATA003 TaxID=3073064 RepID=UPI002872DD2E|nr:spherulation-specific family 4 protein [Cellulomonas sp. ATA003]WNB86348.1 spherulation-specific family 4 protein [Cellulomonas sp. ATA003]
MTPDPIAALTLGVPAYFHPAAQPFDWQRLTEIPHRLRFVVMNVYNGAGAEPDPSYKAIVDALIAAGVRIIGYVDTDYGRRPIPEIAQEVAAYHRRYGIEGVFMDQVSPGLEKLEHYAQAVLAARTAKARFVVLNPGTHPHPGYLDLANVTVTFEGTWSQYVGLKVPTWVTRFPASRFCHLVHTVPDEEFGPGLALAADRHARSVFLTDGRGENPWDHLPDQLLDAVRATTSQTAAR